MSRPAVYLRAARTRRTLHSAFEKFYVCQYKKRKTENRKRTIALFIREYLYSQYHNNICRNSFILYANFSQSTRGREGKRDSPIITIIQRDTMITTISRFHISAENLASLENRRTKHWSTKCSVFVSLSRFPRFSFVDINIYISHT